MYLKFIEPNVPSQGEIEVLSWNHGFAQPTSPTRSAAGSGTVEQATHQNLTFTKYLDATTNELLKACWSGKQFQKATLTCYRADGAADNKPVEYLRIEMQHVIISNYSISGGPGDIPVENVSLDYGIIQYNYKEQKTMHDLEQRKVG
jgi:type VI secretion system secreted protein Hcp